MNTIETRDEITIWADEFADSIGRNMSYREVAYIAYIAAFEKLKQTITTTSNHS